MRRLLASGFVLAAALLVTSGAAWADRITGREGADRLIGTARPDELRGRGGNDRLEGAAGADLLVGGTGADRLDGGRGDDRLAVQADGSKDSARCGRGRDVVTADAIDVVALDCEVVNRQLSEDATQSLTGQHETAVEPDSFAFGSVVVAAFQVGRFVDGGASDTGFATSTNGGRTWRSGSLPGLTVYSKPAGSRVAVSDPVVAYDAVHAVWLIASLGLRDEGTDVLISRSTNGVTWARPLTVREQGEDYDKEWLVCDNWRSSPLRGRCYLSYLDTESGEIRTRSSNDGGLSWSAPVGVPGRTATGVANGAQPVVRPDGTLVVVFAVSAAFASFADPEASQIVAVRSSDGGLSFSPRGRIARLGEEAIRELRAPPLPSADVDAAGTVYVVWQDCAFRDGCLGTDTVLSRSTDGRAWSAPVRVPVEGGSSNVSDFTPALAVDPATSGPRARLAIVYYSLPGDCDFGIRCRVVDAGLARSADGGRSWSRAQRLTAEPMRLHWIADSGIGRFLGDYISVSFAAGRPVPVFALASEPTLAELNQAIFATTRLAP